MESKGLIWFTNNLRVKDHKALHDALNENTTVIGVYFFDPRHFQETNFGFKKTEKYRAKFLIETLHNLQKNLAALHITFYIIQGKPETYFEKLISEKTINTIYHQFEWTSEETAVINKCKELVSKSVRWKGYYDQLLYHPDELPFHFEETPSVFTNFRKKIEKYASVASESEITIAPSHNISEVNGTIPSLRDLGFEDFSKHSKSAFPFSGGEDEALKRLHYYFWESKNLSCYKNTRNGLLGVDYSSKFSPWLANGSLSARTIYHHVKAYEKKHGSNESTYWLIFELIWRDFFKYISMKNQNDIFKIDGILKKRYPWYTSPSLIEKWTNGETKEPFVNANMQELKNSGWMSNRGRQNVASYFAKTLKLDWRIGAAYFESMLLDYDVHSNYGNWMYVAGVGNDPRDRIFNVTLQAERYDSNGVFQKQWLQQTLFQ